MQTILRVESGAVLAEISADYRARLVVQGYVGLGRMLDFMIRYMPASSKVAGETNSRVTAATERIWSLFVAGGGISSRGKLVLLPELPRSSAVEEVIQDLGPGLTITHSRSGLPNSYVLVGPHTDSHLSRTRIRPESEWPADFLIDDNPIPAFALAALGTHLRRTKGVREVLRKVDIFPQSLAMQVLLDVIRYNSRARGAVET